MAAYIVGNYTPTDQEKISKYFAAVPAIIMQYKGKVIILDREAKLKGSPYQIFVVVEFESIQAAQRFNESPEYSAIRHLRKEGSEGWKAIFSSFEMPKIL